MRVRDVLFPDGSMLIAGSDAEIATYRECLKELGDIADGGFLRDHKKEAVKCLSKHYPTVPKARLELWFDTARIFPPETLQVFISIARQLGISREKAA